MGGRPRFLSFCARPHLLHLGPLVRPPTIVFQALFRVHDAVSLKTYPLDAPERYRGRIKTVQLNDSSTNPLGATIRQDPPTSPDGHRRVIVARVIVGGAADQSGEGRNNHAMCAHRVAALVGGGKSSWFWLANTTPPLPRYPQATSSLVMRSWRSTAPTWLVGRWTKSWISWYVTNMFKHPPFKPGAPTHFPHHVLQPPSPHHLRACACVCP